MSMSMSRPPPLPLTVKGQAVQECGWSNYRVPPIARGTERWWDFWGSHTHTHSLPSLDLAFAAINAAMWRGRIGGIV